MVDGFLGRWSQRKQAARAGRPLDEADVAPTPQPSLQEAVAREPLVPSALAATRPAAAPDAGTGTGSDAQAPEALPLPSMQDVAALHSGSDFTPFVARAVAPQVRNAAMKKLFADPHFNVMDGLDTYIDDYSLPDPLPAAMLRKMASAKFMNLFEDDEKADAVAGAGDPAGVGGPIGAAQGDAATPQAPTQHVALADPAADDCPSSEKPEPDRTDPRT
jgi:hypothetical protein